MDQWYVWKGAWMSWCGSSRGRNVGSAQAAAWGGCPGCPINVGSLTLIIAGLKTHTPRLSLKWESENHRLPFRAPSFQILQSLRSPFIKGVAFYSFITSSRSIIQIYYVKINPSKDGKEFEGHFIQSMVKPRAPPQKLPLTKTSMPPTTSILILWTDNVRHTDQNNLKPQTLPSLCWSSYSQISLPLAIHHLATGSNVTFQQIFPVASSPAPNLNHISHILSITSCNFLSNTTACHDVFIGSMPVSSTRALAHEGSDSRRLPNTSAPMPSIRPAQHQGSVNIINELSRPCTN